MRARGDHLDAEVTATLHACASDKRIDGVVAYDVFYEGGRPRRRQGSAVCSLPVPEQRICVCSRQTHLRLLSTKVRVFIDYVTERCVLGEPPNLE